MKTHEARTSASPAHLYNFLKAAYGSKMAERIFKSHGLPRPVNPLRPAVHSRNIVGTEAWA
jgi:hypothetical protein